MGTAITVQGSSEVSVGGLTIVVRDGDDLGWLKDLADLRGAPRDAVARLLADRGYRDVARRLLSTAAVTVARVTFPVRADDNLLWLDAGGPGGRHLTLDDVVLAVMAQGYDDAAAAIRATAGRRDMRL